MHTKSHLYVLDKWTDTAAAEKKPAVKKPAKGCETAKGCESAKLTSGNLLAKGAAAAAHYINTFGTMKHYDDMDDM